jgi:hypothetical protein
VVRGGAGDDQASVEAEAEIEARELILLSLLIFITFFR